jgi:hypothetical protein
VRLFNKLELNLVLSRNIFLGVHLLLRTNRIKLRRSLVLSKNRKLRKKLLLKRRILIAKNSKLMFTVYYLIFSIFFKLYRYLYTFFISLPYVI